MTVGELLVWVGHAVAKGYVTTDTPVYAQHHPHDDVVLFDTNISMGKDGVIIEAWHLDVEVTAARNKR
jgi:hypothetical protein